MSIIHLPNGIGDSTGYSLATASPLELNGNVWYVHYTNGTNAVSPAGQNRQAPLKTLGQAHSNAASGDIIVLMDGHEETLAAAVTISKDVTIVGAGTSSGLPTAKLTNNQAAANMLTITATGFVQIKNVWFEEQSQACSAAKITINTTNGSVVIDDCYFQCGQYDDDYALEIVNSELTLVKDTTFISTATSIATQPYSAIGTVNGTAIAVLIMDNVVVNGGTYGWSKYHAVDLVDEPPVYLAIENCSLLLGSDMRIHSNVEGYVNVSNNSGGCRIDWDGVT